MRFDLDIPVYGDTSYRGQCPREKLEQVTFVRRVREQYPDTFGRLLVHPNNESARKGKEFHKLSMDKALGLTPGASDIIIPGRPSFVCEIKRRDHTKSKWQDGQPEYLRAALDSGCFACVALGADAATEALAEWLKSQANY